MAEISLDMWRETGRELGRGRSRNAWEIAAWYCDSPYANGVSVSAAADMVGITRASMRNFIQVWHATGGKPIHSDLTFTHHLVAIQSGNAEWRRWLDRAASEGWTVEQLAMALKPASEVKSTEKRYGLHLTVEGENALRDLLGAYNRVAPKHVSDDQYISRMLELCVEELRKQPEKAAAEWVRWCKTHNHPIEIATIYHLTGLEAPIMRRIIRQTLEEMELEKVSRVWG